jgi:hypothetical protein
MLEVKKPKLLQKDELMKRKLDMTITKDEAVELQYMDDEERINSIMNRGIEEARRKFETAKEFYESQAETMRNKSKRVYDMKKSTLQHKESVIQQERAALENKSTAEYTNQRGIQKILKEMYEIIKTIKMGREQMLDSGCFKPSETPLPVLPEAIDKTVVLPSKSITEKRCPCGAKCPEIPEKKGSSHLIWKCLYDEAQGNRMLREEEERAHVRRYKEEEKRRKHDMELSRQQKRLEEEADRRRHDELRRKELAGETTETEPPLTQGEEKWEPLETEEEIAEAKKRFQDKYIKKEQPPFTPFGGLPPPDPPRQEKKPVKTIPAGRILYAAPVEVT